MSRATDMGLEVSPEQIHTIRWQEPTSAFVYNYFDDAQRQFVARRQYYKLADFLERESGGKAGSEGWPERLDALIDQIRGVEAAGQREKDTGLLDAVDSYKASKSEDAQAQLVKTHVFDLNDALGGGFRPNQLIVCCGRPGMGKSAFAMEICEYGCGSGVGLYYSLEMSSRTSGSD